MKTPPHTSASDLREQLLGPPPSLTLVTGPSGSGKSSFVREAVRRMDVVRYWACLLPDTDHRALLIERLGSWRAAPAPGMQGRAEHVRSDGEELSPGAPWGQIFDHLLLRAGERGGTLRLVIEEFPRLVESHARLSREVERFWAEVRARGLPVHLVLVGPDGPVFERLRDEEGPFARWIGRRLAVRPLTFRETGSLFPAYGRGERLLAWSVFGGLRATLRACDPGLTLATNVRQAVLAPDAPLLLEGGWRLQLEAQSPARYASLLRSLAEGRREWGDVLAGVPDLSSGGQMAPYLARLQQMGFAEAEASLDAAPGTRRRRYGIVDPFVAFWYRFVLPHLTDLLDGRAGEVWRRRIRPHLHEHAARLFPRACREYLVHHGSERLPAAAREVGGLWGHGFEMDPAGTLRTGAAFYGHAHWGGGRVAEEADEVLQREVRRTRYGFGKEARLRLLFSTDGFTPGLLRRAARSDDVHLLGPEALLP